MIARTAVSFLRWCATVCIVAAAGAPAAVSGDWMPLFNGKDLDGWEVAAGSAESWHVEDGVLYCQGGDGGWLSTREQYSDFELSLEFRLPEGGNSGVFLRAPREGNAAFAGMEIQVLDDHAEQYAELKPTQYTGSIYDVVAASPRVTKKAGEWQKLVIACNARHVKVTLNDTVIVDANLDDHQDKLETHPGLARSGGYIGLQNHGSRLDYRNIQLRAIGDE